MSDASALRDEAAEARAEAAASFKRCDTDGFVSQWASGITAQLADAKADLIEAGGVAEFPALLDVDTGEWVPSKLIDTRYGTAWALLGPAARFTGEFVTAFPKRESTMARKGYREGSAIWPATAVTTGSGTGLAGAASVRVIMVIAAPDGTPPIEIL